MVVVPFTVWAVAKYMIQFCGNACCDLRNHLKCAEQRNKKHHEVKILGDKMKWFHRL